MHPLYILELVLRAHYLLLRVRNNFVCAEFPSKGAYEKRRLLCELNV